MPDDERSLETTAESAGSGCESDLPTEIPSVEHPASPSLDWFPSRPPPNPLEVPTINDLTRLEPGQRLGDFLIRRVIGRGGFAAVYLALQWSLDREVALKVTAPEALPVAAEDQSQYRGEGQHLAQLDHPNIVGVYQQSIEPHTGAQLLCMQYVCGTTLEELVRRLRDRAGCWSGRDFLELIDRLPLPQASLDTAALADRRALEHADHIETVCRLGSQLASALEHAHRRGVFHRDVKPANVLVSRYGQPLLADFNLASGSGLGDSGLVGGTLSYMAAEHLEWFVSPSHALEPDIQRLGDIYSLGVLLWQTSTGQLPFADSVAKKSETDWPERIAHLARQRRQTPMEQWAGSKVLQPRRTPADRATAEHVPGERGGEHHPSAQVRPPGCEPSYGMLAEIIRKCMQGEPRRRYRSAGALRLALVGLVEMHAARRRLPPPGWSSVVAQRYPVAALVIAGLVPQVVASVLQIAYNATRVLDNFGPDQQAAFVQLVYWANPIIYGVCLLAVLHHLRQVLPVWRRLQAGDIALSPRQVARARGRLLRLPRRVATIAAGGWLAGAIIFPGGVMLLAGPLPWTVLLHFLLSFVLAGLISVTYSALAIATVVLRVHYLRFWSSPDRFRRWAAAELKPLDRRLDRITLLAGTIPLAGAATLIMADPAGENGQSLGMRAVLLLLIIAGGIGYFQAGQAVTALRRMIHAWLSDRDRSLSR